MPDVRGGTVDAQRRRQGSVDRGDMEEATS